MTLSKEDLCRELSLFALGGEGIGGWIHEGADARIFARLAQLPEQALTKVQFNQLLALGHEAHVSDDMFGYYWLKAPPEHPYPTDLLPDYDPIFLTSNSIRSLAHLKWGLYRIFVDGLLYFGNVRTGYRQIRSLSALELQQFFASKRFDTKGIHDRGPALPLQTIAKSDRYFISEMAYKAYEQRDKGSRLIREALVSALNQHRSIAVTAGSTSIDSLLKLSLSNEYRNSQNELMFAANDVLNIAVSDEAEIDIQLVQLTERYERARGNALSNTEYYLSMASDLDVYVATSMRSPSDFQAMASDCESIFSSPDLARLNLRYFDPTLSAAEGHEDKGLIECLMVKCAKALVYCAGERDSYGKDAEAAMALSQGKPVIFYCTSEAKSRFYREVHPLSRLIDFKTGVAVGAMVADQTSQVSELLSRIFNNRMEYELDKSSDGYLRLREKITRSVVRIQTSNRLLSETFWNHYYDRKAG